ncbi:MAG TPA: glycosyltransferase family A protein, partial [Candidatus Baltobacteraceae bacterium]|nr:glycosyltransferase family A protein [Candidatus Baltobacteraceae bacterium]
ALAIKKRLRETRRSDLLPMYRRSLAAVQTNCEMLRARRFVETNPAALPPFIWRAWHLDPRSKWLRWYVCLVWPKFLGGNMTRRYVHRKIRSRWPNTSNDSMIKNPPLVSVIMPVWNGATFLAESLCSLQAQTYAHFEVIIVDDGSTDDTPAIARRFCEADSRFTFTQQTHAGVSTARNTALARSRGEFFAFLDADDVWSPEKLARQIELFAEGPRINAVFTNFYMWDGQHDLDIWYRPDKPLPEGDVSRRLVFNVGHVCAASMSVAVIRRELFHEAGFFDTELSIGEDWDLLLRMAECGLRVRVTREPLARYRRWKGNATNQKLKMVESNVQVLQKNLQKTRRPELRPLYKR